MRWLVLVGLVACGGGQDDPPAKSSRDREEARPPRPEAGFAEIRLREEQHRIDTGGFLAISSSESQLFPANDAVWKKLHAELSGACSFAVLVGNADTPVGPLAAKLGFAPKAPWYYALALCAGGAQFFTSSADTTIRKLD